MLGTIDENSSPKNNMEDVLLNGKKLEIMCFRNNRLLDKT